MDPLIKSQLLYQLSYAPTRPAKTGVGGHIAATIGDVQPCRNHFPTNRSRLRSRPRRTAKLTFSWRDRNANSEGLPRSQSHVQSAFRHLDGMAADARGGQFSALHGQFVADARRPTHLQPLLDPQL